MSIVEEIERLHEMHRAGALSKEEFEHAKAIALRNVDRGTEERRGDSVASLGERATVTPAAATRSSPKRRPPRSYRLRVWLISLIVVICGMGFSYYRINGIQDELLAQRPQPQRLQQVPDKDASPNSKAGQAKSDAAEAKLLLGAQLVSQGKFEEAVVAYREAIRLQPDDATAHINLSAALAQLGKHDEAIAEDREAIRLKPDDATAHYNLGVGLASLGKHDESVSEYREAIRLKPDYADAQLAYGRILFKENKIDEAATVYREVIRFMPDDATARLMLGAILLKQEKFSEAVASLREAIRLRPDFPQARALLNAGLRAQGQPEE